MDVVKVRDTLKCGKDYPLTIVLNNQFACNELTDLVVWDDSNKLVWVYSYNRNARTAMTTPVCLFVEGYELIERLELYIPADTKYLEETVTNISKATPITDDQKKHILNSQLANQDKYMASVRQYTFK
jgi:hypothetical protein